MTPSDRCRAEIAAHEQALRSGDEPVQGVLQALQDWQAELREIDRMMEGGTSKPCWLCLDGRVKHKPCCPECHGTRKIPA